MAQAPDEIREAIETDREQLGETVRALAAKADVKARVDDKISERKEQVRHLAAEVRSTATDLSPETVASGAKHVEKAIMRLSPPQALAVGLTLGYGVGRLRRRRR